MLFLKAYSIEKKYEYESYIPKYCKNSDIDFANGILCGFLRKKDEDLLRLINTDVDEEVIRISIQRELKFYYMMIRELQELQLEEWINKHYGVLLCKLPLQEEKHIRNFVYYYCEYRRYKRERGVELKNLGMIGDLAFRGDDSMVYHGKKDIGSLQEALETGRLFEHNAVKVLPELSKLYSQNYEDNLWINHNAEKSEITFEEMKKDFTISGEKVVTQVIHLKYKSETTGAEEKFVITHIDHEYILYTDESYITRTANRNVHGQNKIKTFKADHAEIPLDYPCQAFENPVIIEEEPKEITVPFIYYVLNNFFEHKDLLREYFENILK